jgi:hypothetical protein
VREIFCGTPLLGRAVIEVGHGPVVRDGPLAEPVRWLSWSDWRRGRREPWTVWLRTRSIVCPTCWGQRRIWEPGPLGLLPVLCETCRGRGQIE